MSRARWMDRTVEASRKADVRMPWTRLRGRPGKGRDVAAAPKAAPKVAARA